MAPTLALLPSPLLGPVAWRPVAGELRDRGLAVVLADLPSGAEHPRDVLAGFTAALAGLGDLVLVPHSNAGLYAPALASALPVSATVFVDAALPLSGHETPLAPPDLRAFLAGLADDQGRLPPWSRWWDSDGLFPDAATRRAVQAAEPRLPLSYFDGMLPVPAGWAARRCAYLAFGTTYAEETARARELGWPVEVVTGGHLHLLHDPGGVADAVLGLLQRS